MLPTRSLPPQFLLPSWTAAELVVAVQRSYLSSTATKSFEIKRHRYGWRDTHSGTGSHDSKRQVGVRRGRAERSVPGADTLGPGSRHFKPYAPRPIPTPLAGFYTGKKYNGPEEVPLEDSGSRLSTLTELEDGQHDSKRKTATFGRQTNEIGRYSRTTIDSGIEAAMNSENTSNTQPIEDEDEEQWIDRSAGEGSSRPRRPRNSPQLRKSPGSRFSQETPKIAQAPIQNFSTSEESLVVLQELDMAGRWTDSMNPNSKNKPSQRLPWESDEPPSSIPQFSRSSVPKPRQSVAPTIRIPPPELNHPKETMSLFQELFPEESKSCRAAIRLAEERLDKLPAFKWDMDENFDQNWQTERAEKRAKLYEIPSRREPSPVSTQSMHTDVQHRQEEFTHTPRYQPFVVVLEGLSKYLEESDFFRIGPKGNHIEGWTSGILKVIPARDHTTLQPLGYYYLLFSSEAAARAYMSNTLRIHTLGKSKGPASMPFMPPPPGTLRDGENVKDLLRTFSILPRQNKLSMRLLNKPYRPGVLEMIDKGGPPALANRRANGEALVLFSVDVGTITYHDILFAIKDDGRQRNMHWKFAGGKEVDISPVAYRDSAGKDASGESDKPGRFKMPEKYIFAMKDVQEARRFVREWHRRPIEVVKRGRNQELGQERLAIVNAELIW